MVKVVERIATVPFQPPMLVLGLVPCGRNWIVTVSKPPGRVELVVGLFWATRAAG